MGKVLNQQPFKAIYLVYAATSLVFVKLPCWTLWYLRPSARPRRSWTLKRALIVRVLQDLFTIGTVVDMRGGPKPAVAARLPDSALKDARSAWVEPIPEELFCGKLRRYAEITGVKPVGIPGYWLLKKGYKWNGHKAMPGEKTVLHLHGGAFAYGSARPSDMTANLTRGLLQHSQTLERTFAVDCRLAASAPRPQINPFPAALIDCLAGYWYLVQEAGFEPQNIILAGDSAGANFAIALVRHLLENPTPSLPPPGRMLVVSPCLDLMISRCGPESSIVQNATTDIFGVLPPGELFGRYSIVSYLGPLPLEEADTNRYISPMSLNVKPGPDGLALCKGFPETYIVAGGAERIADDARALKERMDADGAKAVLDIPPDALHDFVVFTWHEPERTETLRRMCRWIDSPDST
ncbi:alpha/beta-hydrolase [Cubamyces sp. BRFM 1775]|nr:alpha/beta-hydrolase [Cubamyces sp. BRFM 1775]